MLLSCMLDWGKVQAAMLQVNDDVWLVLLLLAEDEVRRPYQPRVCFEQVNLLQGQVGLEEGALAKEAQGAATEAQEALAIARLDVFCYA